MNASFPTVPSFSVIVPTYNRPRLLQACLQAIAQMDYPRDRLEVIVVDDGGSQPLDEIVQPFITPLSLKLLRQANAGPGAARNHGATEARGDYLAFTDDDCQPDRQWLRALASQAQTQPTAMLGGAIHNQLHRNPFAEASQLIISYLYQHFADHPQAPRFFTSNNLAVPRDRFLALGGFDQAFRIASEDRELCDRWSQQPAALIYCPAAQVFHSHDLNLFSFWKQHFNYGRGGFGFHRLHAQRQTPQISSAPAPSPPRPDRHLDRLRFYRNLLSYPYRTVAPKTLRTRLWATGLMLLILLAQVATASGMIFEWGRSRQEASNTP
ncbi:glycosyltransferase [Alkalinema sp. FACHB-956]|uniref:glycosyltransferase n=1 Tax=Alkalinema sp. FACHB-956 TaxID=2692768 RepID=UPI001683A836|nr:glycosyltransferase [Alkalinema sp. FACHB-956]